MAQDDAVTWSAGDLSVEMDSRPSERSQHLGEVNFRNVPWYRKGLFQKSHDHHCYCRQWGDPQQGGYLRRAGEKEVLCLSTVPGPCATSLAVLCRAVALKQDGVSPSALGCRVFGVWDWSPAITCPSC